MRILSTDKLVSLVFGGLIFLFFSFLYPFHLNYQEQFQLFLWRGDYFFQFLHKPGGFSDYLGSFFTQFNFYSWVGALLLAMLLTSLQVLVWFISRQSGAKLLFFPLTFIPSLLYWGLLCDENYLLGGLISLIIATSFMGIYSLLKSCRRRIPFALISLPVLYWMTGGAFFFFAVFIIFRELFEKEVKKWNLLFFLLAIILISVVLPFVARHFVVQYTLLKMVTGVNYYRFPVTIPISIGITGILIVTIPFILRILSRTIRIKRNNLLLFAELVVILTGGVLYIRNVADLEKEEAMAYDFYTRMRKWDQVISLANRKSPGNPLSVTCLNLALAQKGLLGEKMFTYYQHSVEGLLPDFVRDFTVPMVAGEVYYHLGFVNTAQRFAFEAMEALPDYQKSVRSVMRLAETNIINGNYEVASKYLHLLQKTFYYRKWATNALNTMKSEEAISRHPEWGWLRKCRVEKDFLFSEKEKDMMLGILFNQNNENQMAYEYLLAGCLLSKDLEHFLQYFRLSKAINYTTIPLSYQEALIYLWEETNKDTGRQMPIPISDRVRERFREYVRILKTTPNPAALLREHFSDTYWYYLNFIK